jgi:hypothetical protein
MFGKTHASQTGSKTSAAGSLAEISGEQTGQPDRAPIPERLAGTVPE